MFGEGMLGVVSDVLQTYGWSSIFFYFKRKPYFYLTFLFLRSGQ